MAFLRLDVENWGPAPPIPDDILKEIEERVKLRRKLEDEKIVEQAEKNAKKKLLENFLLKEYFYNYVEEDRLPLEVKKDETKELLTRSKERLNSKPPYCFLTVNPRREVSLAELQKKVKKLLNKKTTKEYFLVYEIRKAPDEGLHVHILLRYTSRPSDFRRNTKNTFKDICDSNNTHCLNFKFIQENLLKDKVDYMLGDKKDSKKTAVEATIAWRKSQKLKPYEESIPPLPCRDTQIPLLPTDMPTILEID